MTVKECAELMQCDALTIRIALQQNLLPEIGTAFKLRPDSKRYKYIIYEKEVLKRFGR